MKSADIIDLDGNALMQFWFEGVTEQLTVKVASTVETYQTNPFNYLLESWATYLPIDYPSSLYIQLEPYWRSRQVPIDPDAIRLAQEIERDTNSNTLKFLSVLNQRIYENCQQVVRETGNPWSAGVTWREKRGSCRDVSILFMEACRAVGLASRFVSGYQEGDPDTQDRDLHAWVEVYLPGGGWRGYDPTHGLAVGDRHVTLVASPNPAYAAPISGTVTPINPGKAIASEMEFQLSIDIE
jgi:transglutaminase-like putative cysteine protease